MRFPRPCRELLQVRQGVQHGRCPSHGPSPQGGVLMERRGRCCVRRSQECRHNGAHPHTFGLQPALTALLLQGQHPLAFFSRPTNASSSASSSPSATGAHTSGAAASWWRRITTSSSSSSTNAWLRSHNTIGWVSSLAMISQSSTRQGARSRWQTPCPPRHGGSRPPRHLEATVWLHRASSSSHFHRPGAGGAKKWARRWPARGAVVYHLWHGGIQRPPLHPPSVTSPPGSAHRRAYRWPWGRPAHPTPPTPWFPLAQPAHGGSGLCPRLHDVPAPQVGTPGGPSHAAASSDHSLGRHRSRLHWSVAPCWWQIGDPHGGRPPQ